MLIINLVMVFILGSLILKLLRFKDKNVLFKLSLSYLLGIGVTTLLMFGMTINSIFLSSRSVNLSLLILDVLLFIIGLKTKAIPIKIRLPKFGIDFSDWSIREKTLFLVILSIFVFVFISGLYWPVAGWDSIALYDFRALVIKYTGGLEDAIDRGYFFGYPLMTSMMNALVYLNGFRYPRFLYSLIFISFSSLFYQFLLVFIKREKALFFSLLMMLSPLLFNHSFFDYTNMPYTAYFFSGSILLFLWTQKPRQKNILLLSALFMGLSTWIRSTDPFWVVNIIVLMIWSIKNRNFRPFLTYVIFFFPIQQLWGWYLTSMNQTVSTQGLVGSGFSILLSGFDLSRFIEIFIFVLQTLGSHLFLYFFMATFMVIVNFKNISKYFYLNLIVLGNVSLLFVGSYVFSFMWPGWRLIGESLLRIGFIFVPMFIYFSVIQIGDLNKHDRS